MWSPAPMAPTGLSPHYSNHMSQKRFTIVINDGVLTGISLHEDAGKAIAIADLADHAPELNSAFLARVTELEAAAIANGESHEKALADKDVEKADALKALADSHADEIARLTAPPAIDEKLSELGQAFKASVPEDLQGTFGGAFAVVRVLLQAGEHDLARKTVQAIAVPPELESVKEGILAMLPE